MAIDQLEIQRTASEWASSGRGAALATVVETWGSAPRPAGSQLAVSGDGEMAGSVSGGCVEGAVIIEAQDVIADGNPRLLTYGVSDDEAFAVGLACGGQIRVLVEPASACDLADLIRRQDARDPVARVVDLETWDSRLDAPPSFGDRFDADRSGVEADGRTFVAVHNPPLRLILVGAVHIAQPLVTMARLAGYDPILVDPRDVFASQTRFPGEAVQDDWPDVALDALGLDARTAVVTLTHDPKLDDPALMRALPSAAFYVGALGSTRTHAKRADRLTAAGLDAAALSRLSAPVGLDIGAKSPAEIAVSILAEIVQTRRRGR